MANAPHRFAASVLLASALALAVGACGDPDEPGNAAAGPTASAAQGFGENPAPVTTTTAAPAPAPNPPAYPKTHKAYAEAVLNAWKSANIDRLGNLTTPEVQEQIMEIPGPPNLNWTFQRCDGVAGANYCIFINVDGDEIALRISSQLLGKAHANTQVQLDLTEFPANSIDYCKEFVEAWRSANIARMNKLALPDVVEFVRHGPAPTSPGYASVGGGGGLELIRISNAAGFLLDLHVGTTLFGQPQAIRGYTAP